MERATTTGTEFYIVIGEHRFIIWFETNEELEYYLTEASNGICPFRPEMFGANVYKVTN